MYALGEHFLACPAFPRNHHGRVGARHLPAVVHGFPDGPAGPDDILKGIPCPVAGPVQLGAHVMLPGLRFLKVLQCYDMSCNLIPGTDFHCGCNQVALPCLNQLFPGALHIQLGQQFLNVKPQKHPGAVGHQLPGLLIAQIHAAHHVRYDNPLIHQVHEGIQLIRHIFLVIEQFIHAGVNVIILPSGSSRFLGGKLIINPQFLSNDIQAVHVNRAFAHIDDLADSLGHQVPLIGGDGQPDGPVVFPRPIVREQFHIPKARGIHAGYGVHAGPVVKVDQQRLGSFWYLLKLFHLFFGQGQREDHDFGLVADFLADLLEYVKCRHQHIILLYPFKGLHFRNGIGLKACVSAQIFADVVHQKPCILLFRCHYRYLFHPPSPRPYRIWSIIPEADIFFNSPASCTYRESCI